jgi:DNA invertase Pin-like site-specific DNA recombinase
MNIGYVRVSTDEQNHDLQIEALKAAGCERFFEDTCSGGRRHRPDLDRMLDQLRPGDVVVVWKVDRLSRSLRDLLNILHKLGELNVQFRSVTEPAIDTTTPHGHALLQMIGVFAELEKAMIKERTLAGLAVARKAGRIGGRRFYKNGQRFKLSDEQQAKVIRDISSGTESVAACARYYHVNPSTIWRLMKRAEASRETVPPNASSSVN